MRRALCLWALALAAACSSAATSSDGSIGSSATSVEAVEPDAGSTTTEGSTQASTFCDAVFRHREQQRGPDLVASIPLPRVELASRLSADGEAFDDIIRLADAPELRRDLDRLGEMQGAVDETLHASWGDDGGELLAEADVWGGTVVDYAIRDGIEVGGEVVDRGEYRDLRSDLFERLSLVCDQRPAEWVPVADLPSASVPSDLRYVIVMNVSNELQLMLGSTNVPVFPFPTPNADLQFSNPVASPDGQWILATGFDDGVPQRAYVGRFDSLPDMEQVSPDDEAWNCLSWSADSGAVVVTRLVSPGTWKQSEYDIASGEVVDLFDADFARHQMPCGAFYDDDTLLVTAVDPDTGLASVWSQDVGSSERSLFVSIPGCTTIYPQVRPGTGEVAVITACANTYDSGLWIVPEPGAVPRHVLNGLVAAPAWSQDGQWILFGHQQNRTSIPELWIATADGSSASKLVNGWSSWPAWIPAGTSCSFCPA